MGLGLTTTLKVAGCSLAFVLPTHKIILLNDLQLAQNWVLKIILTRKGLLVSRDFPGFDSFQWHNQLLIIFVEIASVQDGQYFPDSIYINIKKF